MGKGVRLVSTEPAKANGFEGVKAIFAFDDINQVQVSQDPDMSGALGRHGWRPQGRRPGQVQVGPPGRDLRR